MGCFGPKVTTRGNLPGTWELSFDLSLPRLTPVASHMIYRCAAGLVVLMLVDLWERHYHRTSTAGEYLQCCCSAW